MTAVSTADEDEEDEDEEEEEEDEEEAALELLDDAGFGAGVGSADEGAARRHLNPPAVSVLPLNTWSMANDMTG